MDNTHALTEETAAAHIHAPGNMIIHLMKTLNMYYNMNLNG